MRYLAALGIAGVLLVVAFWVGSQISIMVAQGTSADEEFIRGRTVDLCGYQVDSRFNLAGYELDDWKGERCESLSTLDHCVLECLASSGTIEAARECYPRCVGS